jgi:hypothetical protein
LSATLRVSREGFAELRRGSFEVFVDGNTVGSIENHGTIEVPIEPGRHAVRLRKGRYSSREQSFDTADSDVINFRCHGARIWPMYVASIVAPNLAISVTRE